ncbi:MAG: fibrobacter succinogenes major paralogous domain-containing protein [Paludibacteraceae bacterium]|nr:fibrobacter succinogenes major paralogous domain-containing protein [Paludibacteraceae bacterium]
MKKCIYLVLVLLVMAGIVSCKKNAEVNEPAPQPTGIMRHVTVSAAGHGTTKTSVISGGALVWSNDDHLNIVPTLGDFDAVALDITEGVGSASGTFEGDIDSGIKDDTQLYGWTGGAWSYSSGTFSIDMPAEQTYVEDGLAENEYPSIGTGSIKNGIQLQNPFGVLCLNVKGLSTDAVESITLMSYSKNLSGTFSVNPKTFVSTAVSGEKSIRLVCNASAVALSSEGTKFRIVVPSLQYNGNDLVVRVHLKDSDFDVPLKKTVTVTPGSAITVNVEKPIPRPLCQKALDSGANWVEIGKQRWLSNNTRCTEYDTESEAYGIVTLKERTKDSDNANYIVNSNSEYGNFYNWAAAMGVENGSDYSFDQDEPRQGICPNGSHVPSDEEWEELKEFIKLNYNTSASSVGNYLKSTDGWIGSGNGDNNTGFSAKPAGSHGKNVGEVAEFWTTVTSEDKSYAIRRSLRYDSNELSSNEYSKYFCLSVRCIKHREDTPEPPKPVDVNRGVAERDHGYMVNWVRLWDNGPKWAEYNVGASSISNFDGYYCWGWHVNKEKDFGEYCKSEEDIQYTKNDIAKKIWGDNWQMPTKDDFSNLLKYCNVVWKTAEESGYGVAGILCKGKGSYSDKSIFLPAIGYFDPEEGDWGSVKKSGEFIRYWSSSPTGKPNDADYAKFLSASANSSPVAKVGEGTRKFGYSVRAILRE